MTRKSTSGFSSARQARTSTGTRPNILYRIGAGPASVEQIDTSADRVLREEQRPRRVEMARPCSLGFFAPLGAQQGEQPLVRPASLPGCPKVRCRQLRLAGTGGHEAGPMTVDDLVQGVPHQVEHRITAPTHQLLVKAVVQRPVGVSVVTAGQLLLDGCREGVPGRG